MQSLRPMNLIVNEIIFVIVLSFLVAIMFSATTLLMYLRSDQSARVNSIPVNATSHRIEIDYLDSS
jgi:hypothetical protein